VAEQTPQAAFGGCLARLLGIAGFFFLVSAGIAAMRDFDGGGNGIGFLGALVPGLALIVASRLVRRRLGRLPQQETTLGAPPPRVEPTQPQSQRPVPTESSTSPRTAPVHIPDLLAGQIPEGDGVEDAMEQIELDDFKPGETLSSAERIKRARNKYNKKP
jgi:hypothetical protein